MAVRVQCPNRECGASLSVSVEALGRRGRCPRCGRRLVVSASMDGLAASAWSDPLTTAPESVPPERLGRYEIREKLGSGAFGNVYLAYDPVMDREIALKVPRDGLLDSPASVERFLREARAAARLRHPHIVPAHDAGSEDGRYYIASAYVPGRTLARSIDERGIDPRHAARIALELAGALHHAHEQGIVHRDVKPSNVILDPDGHAHLMDFGLARLSHAEARLTQDGSILGTPAYLAPEQATGRSAEADAASDQYSLGVTLYELLTGQTPFVGPIEVVLFATIHQPPPPPREINPDVPPGLESICLKALAKKPTDRYPTCRELAEDLERWLGGKTPVARSAAPEPSHVTTAPTGLPTALRDLILEDGGPLLGRVPEKARPANSGEVRPGRWSIRRIALTSLPIIALAVVGTIAATSRRPPDSADLGRRGLAPSPRDSEATAIPSPTSRFGAARPVSFTVESIDPNRNLYPDELLTTGLQVPFKARMPVLDGTIGPDEYGPALAIRFDDDSNPGRVYYGPAVAGPSDLSAWMYTAYTATDLYIAVRVRDQAHAPGDEIELYFDGDTVGNDFDASRLGEKGSPEGFLVVARLFGNPSAEKESKGVREEEWSMARSVLDDGHVFEVRIPLRLIDTKDGPGTVPAASGSTIGFNLVFGDDDSGPANTRAALWHESGSASPYFAGERSWKVRLHLGAIGLQVSHRVKAPRVDGVIVPEEYGPPLGIDFSKDSNLGRLDHGEFRERDEMACSLSMVYTDRDLYLAASVLDESFSVKDPEAWKNDNICIYIDGDRMPNDFSPGDNNRPVRCDREGFNVHVDAAGKVSSALGVKRFEAASKAVPGGYVVELRIPLEVIDTRDGPDFRAAVAGDTLRFNFVLTDYGLPGGEGCLWREAGSKAPYHSGEAGWLVDLHLARPVRYELVEGPGGATLDPGSGVLRWTRSAAFEAKAKIRVVDARDPGLSDESTVTLKGGGSSPPTVSEAGPSSASPPTPEGLLPPRLRAGEASPRRHAAIPVSAAAPAAVAPAPPPVIATQERPKNGSPEPSGEERPKGGAPGPPRAAAPPTSSKVRVPAFPLEPGFAQLYRSGDPLKQGWQEVGEGTIAAEGGGALVTRGGPGFLAYARRQFGDFVLRVDVLFSDKDDDSGIVFRHKSAGARVGEGSGFEIQLHGDPEHYAPTGSLYLYPNPRFFAAGKTTAQLPIGRWNEVGVKVMGTSLEVWVNGRMVASHGLPDQEPGYIGLQHWNSASTVRFRNLQIMAD